MRRKTLRSWYDALEKSSVGGLCCAQKTRECAVFTPLPPIKWLFYPFYRGGGGEVEQNTATLAS